MAIHGNGNEYDITMKCGGGVNTTTSQYKVVGMGWATTTACFTAYMANYATALSDTMTAYGALGIQQSYLSSGSEYCTVRLFGLSKAMCAGSIAAGDFVNAYDGVSTTTHPGNIETLDLTVSATTMVILGRALEDGSTGTVITVMLNPQLRHQI